jgi:hypothetical protein
MLEPDRNQIEIFVDAVFRHASTGFISLRAFYEGEDKSFRISSVPVIAGNFKFLCDVVEDDTRRAAQDPKPVVFCPPLATFSNKDNAREKDIAEGLTLSVECDENPAAARAALEPLLGPVTIAVRSGGIWQSNGAAYDKMHLHWRLAKPATGQEQLEKLKRAREIAAQLVGADPTTAPICHPLRWPGSWHRKAQPRPCEIILDASNFDREIDLDEALAKLEPFAPVVPADGNGAYAAQPGGDWGELEGKIVRGENLHVSINRLAMKMLKGGASEIVAVQILRGLMEVSPAPRDQRWQARFDGIPRAIRSAGKKLAAGAVQGQANAPAPGASAPMPGNGGGLMGPPPPASSGPQPGTGSGSGVGSPPPPSGPTTGPQPGPGPGPQPTPTAQPPTIQLIEGELPRVIDEAEAALLADIARQQLYQRGELVVRPVRLKLRAADMQGHKRETSGWQLLQVTKPYMIETFTRVARFERWNERAKDWLAKNCPGWVAETYLARAGRWRIPVLLRIVNAPFLRSDGSLCERPGYDPDSALLYILGRGQSFPSVPVAPTLQQARGALTYLDDTLFEEFPFVEKIDRSVALSLVLTALDRHAMATAPLHAFTSPVAGTGKSLIVDLASLLASGEITPVISQGSNKDETEKRLGAELLSGNTIVSFDNCSSEVDSELLCQALTQRELRVRELGYSRNVRVPITALFTVNGNNLVITNDLTRRTLLCQLDAGVERPETRKFKRKVDEVAREQRGELVAAALTILRGWHAAQTIIGIEPMGSFEEWSYRIRCPLLWLDRADPCDSIKTIRENDPLRSLLNAVLIQWKAALGAVDSFTVQQVIDKAVEQATGQLGIAGRPPIPPAPDFYHALIPIAGAKGGGISNDRLGRWLNKSNGKIVGKLKLARVGNNKGYPLWQVIALTGT